TEQGVRALLNLGHTFGHAIETDQGYGVWLHGEAVGTGMLMAAELSARMGWLSSADVERIAKVIGKAGLPLQAPEDMGVEDFLRHMQLDKKNVDGRLRLILLERIGRAVITEEAPAGLLADMLEHWPRSSH
ncbi:3-dehydroquinate synthase family protein, partial [Cobetia marina]